MSQEIKEIQPQEIWRNFAKINAIPRASRKEEAIIAYMKAFGENLGLEVVIDPVQNVIITKPATVGMENRKTIVMQSHLDMVHQKNNDTIFDFDTEGIKMYVDGDWVKAKGTTLGADNGLGVATIMAVLESTDIPHPAIEALFTIDEESGMTGALGLQAGYLTGEILLNLDTEDDDELGVGCAGGMDITATHTYLNQETSTKAKAYKITVKGLQGGHSGVDIHKEFGNANKIMNRILMATFDHISIAEIDGGSLRNAIPRESNSMVVINDEAAFKEAFAKITNDIKEEFKNKESNLTLTFKETTTPGSVLPDDDALNLLQVIYASFNGVFRMSPDIEGLVETSNNVAKVRVGNGEIAIKCLTRSSIESGKWDLVHMLESTFEMIGYVVTLSGEYPGWKPNTDSNILKVVKKKYTDIFKEEPKVIACHAGLECGILGANYPEMDMISFGPTIKGAHSPDERASISSVQKYWKFFLEIIKDIPERN
tara:strand:+ start:6551 stop:8002 length:1452 start_codon:yes stop_codon:yes gene_type:complete